LLPLIELLLLVGVVIGDPVEITRRSRWLRGLSIGLVVVLVFGSLWETVVLISDLIQGGPETNSAGDLLQAGSIVWVSNNIAFSLLTGSSTEAARRREPTTSKLARTWRSPSS
jgi:hypothetical protein